jgi:DNA-binding transcriptional LysR family regulator
MNTIHSKIATLDLNLLRVLHVMMRERNVSKAAIQLNLTQSATSHALRRLRQALDDPLFVASGRKMQPTEKAGRLAATIAPMFDELGQQLEQTPEFSTDQTHSFRVAGGAYFELLILPKLLERLPSSSHVSIHSAPLTQSDFQQELADNSIDLVLGARSMEHLSDQLKTGLVQQDEMVCMVAKDSPLFKKRALSLDEFCKTPQIFTSIWGGEKNWLDQLLTNLGKQRIKATTVQSFGTLPALLASGKLLVLTTRRIGEYFQQFHPLVLFSAPQELRYIGLFFAWHPLYDKDPASLWLREQIKQLSV